MAETEGGIRVCREAGRRQGFEKNLYNHDEVFSDIRQSPFTIREAAEYLEVAEITVRRWAKDGSLKPERLGRNIVFDADDLKKFKMKKLA